MIATHTEYQHDTRMHREKLLKLEDQLHGSGVISENSEALSDEKNSPRSSKDIHAGNSSTLCPIPVQGRPININGKINVCPT